MICFECRSGRFAVSGLRLLVVFIDFAHVKTHEVSVSVYETILGHCFSRGSILRVTMIDIEY